MLAHLLQRLQNLTTKNQDGPRKNVHIFTRLRFEVFSLERFWTSDQVFDLAPLEIGLSVAVWGEESLALVKPKYKVLAFYYVSNCLWQVGGVGGG